MSNIEQQHLQLLARKAVLLEELKAIDSNIGQLVAIAQYIQSQTPAAEPAVEPKVVSED